MASSTQLSRSSRRPNARRFTALEVVEMLQTEGSDVDEEPTEVGSGTTDTNCNNRGTNSTSSDGKGSSSSNLGLIIGATAGGVVVVAMAIGISIYCYKKRSSGVTTPPPIVGPASHPADRGVAATLDVKPTEEEAGEKDSEASEATDVSETSEEP